MNMEEISKGNSGKIFYDEKFRNIYYDEKIYKYIQCTLKSW